MTIRATLRGWVHRALGITALAQRAAIAERRLAQAEATLVLASNVAGLQRTGLVEHKCYLEAIMASMYATNTSRARSVDAEFHRRFAAAVTKIMHGEGNSNESPYSVEEKSPATPDG